MLNFLLEVNKKRVNELVMLLSIISIRCTGPNEDFLMLSNRQRFSFPELMHRHSKYNTNNTLFQQRFHMER